MNDYKTCSNHGNKQRPEISRDWTEVTPMEREPHTKTFENNSYTLVNHAMMKQEFQLLKRNPTHFKELEWRSR